MGGKIFSSSDVHALGATEVARRAVAPTTRGCKSLYLSIDIDAMDAGFLPGTGSIVPSGKSPRQYCQILDVIAQEPIDGIGIAEVAPSLDPSGRIERIAAQLLFRVLRNCILNCRKSLQTGNSFDGPRFLLNQMLAQGSPAFDSVAWPQSCRDSLRTVCYFAGIVP